MKAQWYQHSQQMGGINRRSFIINDTQIFIGSDPTYGGWTEENAKSIDAWVNVSDTPCNSLGFVPFKCERYWYPLTEIHRWNYSHSYWLVKVLDSLIFNRDDIKRVYIHCQAGTRRSPTSFQFWLISLFGYEQALSIFPDHENDKQHFLDQGRYNEFPPDLELFFKFMRFKSPTESLDSLLMDFNTLTKGKHSFYIGSPKISKKKKSYIVKRDAYISNIEAILDTKVINNKVSCSGIKGPALGKLDVANDFHKHNNLTVDYNDFIVFCANLLLKRKSWNYPMIFSTDGSNELRSLKIIELNEYFNKYHSYPKVSFKNEDNVCCIKFL